MTIVIIVIDFKKYVWLIHTNNESDTKDVIKYLELLQNFYNDEF